MPDMPNPHRRPTPATEPIDVLARYFCDACNQEIFVLLDVSAGHNQELIEECPVCGAPMKLWAVIHDDGRAQAEGWHE